jgi:hypothetical protein
LCTAGDVSDVRYRIPIGTSIGASSCLHSAPTNRVGLGGTAKIYAGETSIWAAGVLGGGCGAAERGPGRGRGGAEARGLVGGLPAVFAHGRSGRTPGRMWAKKRRKKAQFFRGKKTNNLRFRVFFASLGVTDCRSSSLKEERSPSTGQPGVRAGGRGRRTRLLDRKL